MSCVTKYFTKVRRVVMRDCPEGMVSRSQPLTKGQGESSNL